MLSLEEYSFCTGLSYSPIKAFLYTNQEVQKVTRKKKKKVWDKGNCGNADQTMNSYRNAHQSESVITPLRKITMM